MHNRMRVLITFNTQRSSAIFTNRTASMRKQQHRKILNAYGTHKRATV
jgi:hypothetical protein